MAGNVFVSFDQHDPRQCQSFSLLRENPRHPFDFRDPVTAQGEWDQNGRPLRLAPGDPGAQAIRDERISKFEKCTKLIVLIGEDTWQSEWTAWEIDTFFALKRPVSGDRTWWRIRGMTIKGCAYATIPQALNGQSTRVMSWDPEGLDQWLDLDPDA